MQANQIASIRACVLAALAIPVHIVYVDMLCLCSSVMLVVLWNMISCYNMYFSMQFQFFNGCFPEVERMNPNT